MPTTAGIDFAISHPKGSIIKKNLLTLIQQSEKPNCEIVPKDALKYVERHPHVVVPNYIDYEHIFAIIKKSECEKKN